MLSINFYFVIDAAVSTFGPIILFWSVIPVISRSPFLNYWHLHEWHARAMTVLACNSVVMRTVLLCVWKEGESLRLPGQIAVDFEVAPSMVSEYKSFPVLPLRAFWSYLSCVKLVCANSLTASGWYLPSHHCSWTRRSRNRAIHVLRLSRTHRFCGSIVFVTVAFVAL